MKTLSAYEYAPFTTEFSGEVDAQPALPRLSEPEGFPAVVERSGESLVLVQGERVSSRAVYFEVGWRAARPFVVARSGVVERLERAAGRLPEGFGLTVFDAWRPLSLQQEIYEAAYSDPTLPAGFVSVPQRNPLTPPPHLTGGTVDVTLTWQGEALRLGSEFDDFTDAAYAASLEGEACPERELRRMLYWAMRSEGFVVHAMEWWHFEWGTRRWAALTGEEPVYAGVDACIPRQRQR